MDIVSAAVNLQAASSVSKVQIAVASKILQSQKQDGAAALQLIQAAFSNVSKAGDALTAQATGLGGALDVRA